MTFFFERSLLSSLILLAIISTAYEKYIDFKGNITSNDIESNHLLKSFSILRNTRLLFTKNNRFECLDTIRFLLSIIVILGHEFLLPIYLCSFSLKNGYTEVLNSFKKGYNIVYTNLIILDAFFTLRYVKIIEEIFQFISVFSMLVLKKKFSN